MVNALDVPDRAIVFIDGNNWYHGLKASGVRDLGRLDYARISRKLAGPRLWTATRYYIGRVPLSADGDFTPAVEAARTRGKRVYAASALPGAQLASAVNAFIPLRRDWFDDCYEE